MSLPGRWQMIRAEFDGAPAPDLVVQHTELRFTATHYAIYFDGEPADQGTFESAGDADSRNLILHPESGPNAGRTLRCLFQLTGDRLRICFGLDGTPPTAFATAADSHRYLATYRRL